METGRLTYLREAFAPHPGPGFLRRPTRLPSLARCRQPVSQRQTDRVRSEIQQLALNRPSDCIRLTTVCNDGGRRQPPR